MQHRVAFEVYLLLWTLSLEGETQVLSRGCLGGKRRKGRNWGSTWTCLRATGFFTTKCWPLTCADIRRMGGYHGGLCGQYWGISSDSQTQPGLFRGFYLITIEGHVTNWSSPDPRKKYGQKKKLSSDRDGGPGIKGKLVSFLGCAAKFWVKAVPVVLQYTGIIIVWFLVGINWLWVDTGQFPQGSPGIAGPWLRITWSFPLI